MKLNVGALDRTLRVALGLAMLNMLFALQGDTRWWGLIGIAPLLTGLMGWCPLYRLLGITRRATSSTS